MKSRFFPNLLRGLFAALGLAFVAAASAHDTTVGDLHLVHPVARPTPLAGGTGAVYLQVENHGSSDDTLLGASTPEASSARLHTMTMDGDVMRMREAPQGLVVPAGGALTLSSGGNHLMLIGLTHALVAGETLPLTLRFAKAGAVPVDVHVEAAATDAPATDPHAGHHHPN